MNINDLYQKVSEFDGQISSETLEKSHCKNLCSKCCYVDLSVFSIEADNIRSWYSKLSDNQKNELKSKWSEPLNLMSNFHGEMVNSCAFLHKESCTIYEARPLICRTQGLPLKFKEGSEEYLDICPLNEEMLDVLKSQEVMNLDLLNMILVQLEKMHSKDSEVERISLTDLRDSLV